MVPTKQLVTLRMPSTVVDEVRRLAERDAETQSSILRRLVRHGLDFERRTAPEAAA